MRFFDILTPFWHLGSTLGSHFGVSGARWDAMLAPRDHPGGPWEQQDGHEVANNRIFVDLGVISGPVSCSFWCSKCVKFHFIFRLVSRSSFYRFLTRIIDVWDFQIVVVAWKVLQNLTFHGSRFKEMWDRFLMFLGCLGSVFLIF